MTGQGGQGVGSAGARFRGSHEKGQGVGGSGSAGTRSRGTHPKEDNKEPKDGNSKLKGMIA